MCRLNWVFAGHTSYCRRCRGLAHMIMSFVMSEDPDGPMRIWTASSENNAFGHAQNVLIHIILCMQKYHPGICSLCIYSVVSNDSVSGQWMPRKDCADMQANLGIRCPYIPRIHSFAWRGPYKIRLARLCIMYMSEVYIIHKFCNPTKKIVITLRAWASLLSLRRHPCDKGPFFMLCLYDTSSTQPKLNLNKLDLRWRPCCKDHFVML